ncbi:tyrosine-type recombinase/integrase [bacterium]|nr:tyrosine-type recombinase/integrase [bacterium]
MRTDYLLEREVDRVLSALMPSNRLAFRVSLHTGLRISDVLSLKTKDLKPQFWITESKTGKRKRVNLPGPLLADLRAHAGKVWVFPHRTKPDQHRTRQAVWADVKRARIAFRLPQNIGTHSARKFYAVQLYEKYGSFDRVVKALNHAKKYPETTMIYAMADKLLEAKMKRRGRKKS